MSMTLFEFFIVGFYLAMLTSLMVAIQVLDASRIVRESLAVEQSDEKFADSDDECTPFNPETETYEMTENPMLRHRIVEQKEVPLMEQVD